MPYHYGSNNDDLHYHPILFYLNLPGCRGQKQVTAAARSNVPTRSPLPEIGSWQERGHKAVVKYSLVYCLYRADVGVHVSPL